MRATITRNENIYLVNLYCEARQRIDRHAEATGFVFFSSNFLVFFFEECASFYPSHTVTSLEYVISFFSIPFVSVLEEWNKKKENKNKSLVQVIHPALNCFKQWKKRRKVRKKKHADERQIHNELWRRIFSASGMTKVGPLWAYLVTMQMLLFLFLVTLRAFVVLPCEWLSLSQFVMIIHFSLYVVL